MEELKKLKEACKPIIEFLKQKHPNYTVIVTRDEIKLLETEIGVPLTNDII